MKNIPIYDNSAPIACTATDGEVAERIETIEHLRANLVSVERTDHGLLLRFAQRGDIEAAVRRFAADEKGCCQFWGFGINVADGHVQLRWDGPPAVNELMDRLQSYFEGDEPVTAIEGLL